MKPAFEKKSKLIILNLRRQFIKILFGAVAMVICAAFALNVFYNEFVGKTYKAFSFNSPAVTVIVDAGHGGEDGGAVSPGKVLEKDINLKIALKLKDILILNGFNVIMTRESDAQIYDAEFATKTLHKKKESDIANRIKIANQNNNAIFISIHQNTFPQSSVSETQVFYSKGNKKSKQLATVIQTTFKEQLGQDKWDRQAKQMYDDILLFKKISNAAVLIECGFLSNPNEEQLLQTDEYQTKIAFTIINSLYKYLGESGAEAAA